MRSQKHCHPAARLPSPRRTVQLILQTALAGTLCGIANAQQAAAISLDKPDDELSTVVITGSLIKRTDTETPSPVQIISADALRQSGYTNIADVLRNLSANSQGALGQSFGQSFAAGGQGVALRGLTVGGTLTLIDGERMVSYPLSDDNERSFVDITAIPFNAVEGVEVLKDGASALYGADAIAGVVNVKLKRKFVGAEITAEAGTSYKRDGTGYHLAGIFGTGDLLKDGYNAYIAIDFHHTDQIAGTARHGAFTNLDWSGLPGGINTTPGAAANPLNPYPGSTTGYLLNPGDPADANLPAQYFLPGCTADLQAANRCTYRFPGLIQPPSEQTNVLARFTKGLANDWQLVTTASVFVSNAEQVAASSAGNPIAGTNYQLGGQTNIAFGPGLGPALVSYPPITVQPGALGNPYSQPAPLIYNFGDIGPMITQTSTVTYRLVEDLRGTLLGWDIDANLGGMYSSMSLKQFGDLSYGVAQQAINEGAYIPGLTVNGGPLIAAEVEYHPSTQLDIAGISASRQLLQLPGGPLSLGLGTQYFYKAQNVQPAQSIAQGIQIGNQSYTVGSQSNIAVFAEIDAQPIKMLELNGAIRYDHYNTYGGTAVPKFGVKLMPIEQLALRATWGKGFRAPSPSELGNSGSIVGTGSTYDDTLCPGGVPNVAGTYNSQCAIQLIGYQISNAPLKAVTSNSATFGIVVAPLQSLSLSIDYYRIRLTNDIILQYAAGGLNSYTSLTRGPTATLPQCTATATPCPVVNTTTPVGLEVFAEYPYVNAGTTQTNGLDFDLQSNFDVGRFGNLKARLTWTHMIEYNLTVQGNTFQLAGTHGPSALSGDTGNPKDRGTLALTWERDAASLTLSANYTGPFSLTDPSAGNTTCQLALTNSGTWAYGPHYAGGSPLPAAWYPYCSVRRFIETNVYANYQVNEHLDIHGSVTNLFNAAALVDLQTYGGGGELPYDAALHQDGAVGRYFTLGATYRF
jgi:iron complex outermembrane recepter protein